VDYLCEIAIQTRRFKEDWKLKHLRYYQIAGITIQLSADFPITDSTFAAKFEKFRVDGPGEDTISLKLHNKVLPRSSLRLGKIVFRRAPWIIYRGDHSWIYLVASSVEDSHDPGSVAIFDEEYHQGNIYNSPALYEMGALHSLTTLTSDQVLLAQVLSNRQGFFLHASGIVIDGKGFLFVGHSEAGKSTMLKMLRQYGEILCDDRIILRRWPEGFRIHGTWSHGELPDVSPASAPLTAILYLEKAVTNQLEAIQDKQEKLGLLLSHVIKPLVTVDWWDKTLDLAGKVVTEVPTYRLRFDKSGEVVNVLNQLS
jgi:hypothetical protein